MPFHEAQIMAAATVFAELLLEKKVIVELIDDISRGAMLYGGSKQARALETIEANERFRAAAGTLRQKNVIAMGDYAFHDIVAEIVTQVNQASLPDTQTALELYTTSRGQHSPEITAALKALDLSFPYGESPRVNVCLYTDGMIEVLDRETGNIIDIPYAGQPETTFKRPVYNGRYFSDIMRGEHLLKEQIFRYGGEFVYKRVSPDQTLAEIRQGVFTGKRTNKAEEMENPYLFITPDNMEGVVDPTTIDPDQDTIPGIKNLSAFGSDVYEIGYIASAFTSRGIVPLPQPVPAQGTLQHRTYPFFQLSHDMKFLYGADRICAKAGDWVGLTRGEDGLEYNPVLTHFTRDQLAHALATRKLVACAQHNRPMPYGNAPLTHR